MEHAKIGSFLVDQEMEIKTGPFGTQLKASDYTSSGVPVLNVRNLGLSDIRTDKLEYVGSCTADRLSAHLLTEGDIVFGRKGAVERHSYISIHEQGWMQGSDCIRLRVHTDRINPQYLSYYFLTNEHKAYMMSACSHGTTMASLNQGILEQISFPLPPRKTQDSIVRILSLFDRMIANNKRINDNLQQQAFAIFSDMFPLAGKGESANGVLSDIADITMGQSPSGESYNEEGIGTVFFQGRAEFGFRFPSIRLFTTEPKRMASLGDTLVSVRAPVGDLNIAHEDCCVGRGLAAVHSNSGHSSFILYTLFSLREQLDVYNGQGTVFGSINRKAMNELPVFVPNDSEMDKFECLVSPIDTIIRNNHDENQRLVSLRDALLPRLMSGEIDVSAVPL